MLIDPFDRRTESPLEPACWDAAIRGRPGSSWAGHTGV